MHTVKYLLEYLVLKFFWTYSTDAFNNGDKSMCKGVSQESKALISCQVESIMRLKLIFVVWVVIFVVIGTCILFSLPYITFMWTVYCMLENRLSSLQFIIYILQTKEFITLSTESVEYLLYICSKSKKVHPPMN